MSDLMYCINWTDISLSDIGDISKTVLAVLGIITLFFNLYVFRKQNNQRIEDIRARLSFDIMISDFDSSYMLKIKNIGKETAHSISIKVHGEPIENNLYQYITDAFAELANKSFSLPAGESLLFYILPSDETAHASSRFISKTPGYFQASKWLDEYRESSIIIEGSYNNKYKINEELSIRGRYMVGSFVSKDPLNHIASILSEIQKTNETLAHLIELKQNNGQTDNA